MRLPPPVPGLGVHGAGGPGERGSPRPGSGIEGEGRRRTSHHPNPAVTAPHTAPGTAGARGEAPGPTAGPDSAAQSRELPATAAVGAHRPVRGPGPDVRQACSVIMLPGQVPRLRASPTRPAPPGRRAGLRSPRRGLRRPAVVTAALIRQQIFRVSPPLDPRTASTRLNI